MALKSLKTRVLSPLPILTPLASTMDSYSLQQFVVQMFG